MQSYLKQIIILGYTTSLRFAILQLFNSCRDVHIQSVAFKHVEMSYFAPRIILLMTKTCKNTQEHLNGTQYMHRLRELQNGSNVA